MSSWRPSSPSPATAPAKPSATWPSRPTGSRSRRLPRWRSRFGIVIVAGFAEREGDAVYSAAALVEPGGRRVIYRKCQLYGDYEKVLFTARRDGAAAGRAARHEGRPARLLRRRIPRDDAAPGASRSGTHTGADRAADERAGSVHRREACPGAGFREPVCDRLCRPCRQRPALRLWRTLVHRHARRAGRSARAGRTAPRC